MVEKPTTKAWGEIFPEAKSGIPKGWERPTSAINLIDLPEHSPVRALFEAASGGEVFEPQGEFECLTPKGVREYNRSSAAQAREAGAAAYAFERQSWGENGMAARESGWRMGEVLLNWDGLTFACHFWWAKGHGWQAGKVKLSTDPWKGLKEGGDLVRACEGRVLVSREVAAVLVCKSQLRLSLGGTWVWEDHEGLPEGLICLRETEGIKPKAVAKAVAKAERLCEAARDIGHYHEDNPHGLMPEHLVLAGVALNSSGRKTEDPSEYTLGIIELPGFLGSLEDQLWGPSNGDRGVARDRVWATRPGYSFESPFVLAHTRPARYLVWVGLSQTRLWTAYGSRSGVVAPKEVNDPYLSDSEREESEAFWAEHAFAYRDGEQEAQLLTKMKEAGCTYVWEGSVLVHLHHDAGDAHRRILQERWKRVSLWDPRHQVSHTPEWHQRNTPGYNNRS